MGRMLILSALAVGLGAAGCALTAKAKEQPHEARKTIQLTVYSQDFAVVKESRPVTLSEGLNRIGITGISKQLDQDSLIFEWDKPGPQVVSSTYDLGAGNSQHLLQRFVGRQVELVRYGEHGGVAERLQGVLQLAEPGQVVLKVGDQLLINPPGTIIAPTDTGIVAIPQLTAEVQSKSNESADMNVTYLTRGMSWNADYVATLKPDSDEIQLECWATVTNTTGADYPEAEITFVAGSPNRAVVANAKRRALHDGYAYAAEAAVSRAVPALGGAPVAVGELYAYPRKV
ncbi:MAG TPA: DUF4139 domain-containing protein, partial [Fimbriimonadaceae bacterium]|nr:DUF4139 domain-containing protein [Fimbriimonadaceae bacterium]